MARKRKNGAKSPPGPLVIHPDAAGIDIGATEIFVAVPADRDATPVRSSLTFTQDLNALADWLRGCGIKTVAMESTGVYWIPLFQILETRGFEVCLVNAHHAKNVPGVRVSSGDLSQPSAGNDISASSPKCMNIDDSASFPLVS